VNAVWRGLWSYWAQGGILLIPIGAVSFLIWREFTGARLRLQREMRMATETGVAIAGFLRTCSVKEAARKTGELPGLVASIVAEALNDIAAGGAPLPAIQARENVGLAGIDRSAYMLSALTAAAPLLGLLGTVMGMIRTFQAVGGTGDLAGGVASGVSCALITTEFGLMVAIPGVFGAARIRRLAGYVRVGMARCRAITITELAKRGAPKAEAGAVVQA
jgi:biopolymer transport protein ExbB